MSDLKPCPFCGASLAWSDTYREYHHPVGECILSGHKFKKGMIGQWSRRSIDPAAIREAALREAAASVQAGYSPWEIQQQILALIDKPAPDHSAAPGNMIDNPSNPGG